MNVNDFMTSENQRTKFYQISKQVVAHCLLCSPVSLKIQLKEFSVRHLKKTEIHQQNFRMLMLSEIYTN